MNTSHEIGLDYIRTLAIQAHALDTQFDSLFNWESICGESEPIFRSYNRLMSTTLLSLAVAIRVSLSNVPKYAEKGHVNDAGLLEIGAERIPQSLSFKDVCDKLIHTDRFFKPKERGVRGACWELQGTHRGKPWAFGLSVRIFTEYVLLWLDELEAEHVSVT